MKKIHKTVLKCIAFVVVLMLVFSGVGEILNCTEDYRHPQWLKSFFEQKHNSLDAVYVGSSAAYAYWCAPLAWNDYGITSHLLCTSGQRILLTKYAVKYALKNQPDALIIFSMNTVSSKYTEAQVHYFTDELPLSLTKYKLVKEICDYTGYDMKQFLFPLYLYHSRWSSITEKDFNKEADEYKGAPAYSLFLKETTDVTQDFEYTTDKLRPSDNYMAQLNSTLDYIEKKKVNILFIFSIQAADEKRVSYFNYLTDYLRNKGYNVLNMYEHINEIGLDLTTDFYNEQHANVKGAVKTTAFLAKYLAENYDFTDKRGDKHYSDWDEAYEEYSTLISKYIK